ncbi:hypothetical protein EVC37_21440 [Methylocaldum sp. BRCS4]|jgi:hypothetical protein|nr:hypothetical protein [Methylocaldum sp. BRCS4]
MNKSTVKKFIAWLEEASDNEIKTRQQELLSILSDVTTREGKADVRLALRLIDEEILARIELDRLQSKRP